LKGPGLLKTSECNHLMMYYDNRFSADHRLIFLLYNQLQRHRVSRRVATKCIADNKVFSEFEDIVMDDNFYKTLLMASTCGNSPQDKQFKIVIDKLGKILNIFGGDVPFSPVERSKTLSMLYAMIYSFGMASYFISVSPPDQDNHIFLNIVLFNQKKINHDKMNNSDDYDFKQHDKEDDGIFRFEIFRNTEVLDRLKLIVKYPGLSAKLFHHMVENMLKYLFCIESSQNSKKSTPLDRAERRKGELIIASIEYI